MRGFAAHGRLDGSGGRWTADFDESGNLGIQATDRNEITDAMTSRTTPASARGTAENDSFWLMQGQRSWRLPQAFAKIPSGKDLRRTGLNEFTKEQRCHAVLDSLSS